MSAISDVPIVLLYGALYFAAVVSAAFYGMACMQVFFYYVRYRDESLRMKSFVATLWALTTIHQAVVISGTYKYMMAGMVDLASRVNFNPELVIQIFLKILVALPTQGFFVYRIYTFSGRNILAPVLWFPTAIYQLVSILIYVGNALYSADGVHVEPAVLSDSVLVGMLLSCAFVGAGVDILLAISLTCLLVCERSGTGPVLKRTVHLLQRLTVLAVNSGIWTATFAILSAIMLRIFPSNLLHSLFGIPLCTIYCNTLLANLNSRMYIRDGTTSNGVGMSLWTRSQASDDTKDDVQHGELGLTIPPCQVWKTTEVVTFSDADWPRTFRGAGACS